MKKLTTFAARDVADEIDPPAERVREALAVLRGSGRPGPVNRHAIGVLEAVLVGRGEPIEQQEAA